jgi:integrase
LGGVMQITQKAIEKLKPGKDRLQYMDDAITGFGIRVQPEGEKSFFWSARINGKLRFRMLGKYPAVSVEQARIDAQKLNVTAGEWRRSGYQGVDPFEKQERIVPPSTPTFIELVEAYIENQVKEKANHPADAEYDVRWKVKRHFNNWRDRKIDAITVKDVLAVKNECGKRHHLANRAVEFIRTLYAWSAKSRNGRINFWPVENPAKSVELHDEKPRERFLQPDELVRFNDALDNEPCADLKDFLILAMNTGARRSDIFSMRWSDLHWERLTWSVPYPKNDESYDVGLLPSALAVLERRRTQARDSDVYVFPGVGKTGHLTDLKKPWQAFRKRARIPDIRLHDIRRTVGSYQAMALTRGLVV